MKTLRILIKFGFLILIVEKVGKKLKIPQNFKAFLKNSLVKYLIEKKYPIRATKSSIFSKFSFQNCESIQSVAKLTNFIFFNLNLVEAFEFSKMDVEDFRKNAKEVVDYICSYFKNVSKYDVAPDVEPGYLKPLLPGKKL